MSNKTDNGEKYHRKLSGVGTDSGNSLIVDIYSILSAYDTDPAIDHAVKKLLCAGTRGHKDSIKDKREAVRSIERSIELELAKQAKTQTGRTLRSNPCNKIEQKPVKKLSSAAIHMLFFINKNCSISINHPFDIDSASDNISALDDIGYISIKDSVASITQSGVNFLRSLDVDSEHKIKLSDNELRILKLIKNTGAKVYAMSIDTDTRCALFDFGLIETSGLQHVKLTSAGKEYLKTIK